MLPGIARSYIAVNCQSSVRRTKCGQGERLKSGKPGALVDFWCKLWYDNLMKGNEATDDMAEKGRSATLPLSDFPDLRSLLGWGVGCSLREKVATAIWVWNSYEAGSCIELVHQGTDETGNRSAGGILLGSLPAFCRSRLMTASGGRTGTGQLYGLSVWRFV